MKPEKVVDLGTYERNLKWIDWNEEKIQGITIESLYQEFKARLLQEIDGGEIKSTSIRVPITEIINTWNRFAEQHHLPQCVKKTKKIEGQIRARWREDLPELEHWANYLEFISKSNFLMGKTQSHNSRPFRITLEWATNQTNFGKIASRQYHG